MSHDRRVWEERYRGDSDRTDRHTAGAVPSTFLVAQADRLHGRILDIAAGAGRNALFLARRGNTIEALDSAFAGLQRAHAAALAAGLRVLAIQADLETFPLPLARYDAVINIRYLQRSLFTPLHRAVKPGGFILFETFLIDQQLIGHPRNPDFLLQPGELRACFSECEMLIYEEGLCETEGQPAYLARMLARRPQHGRD